MLPPTFARRLIFCDAGGELWAAIRRYFEPLTAAFPVNRSDSITQTLEDVAKAVYMLTLATRQGAELPLNIGATLKSCELLAHDARTTSEARARLTVLHAMFAAASAASAVPALTVRPGAERYVRDALEEILDDAEFLQASRLRRFFSIAANKRAVLRDLRRVVQAFASKKPWARVVAETTTSLASLGVASIPGSSAAIGALRTAVFEGGVQESTLIVRPLPDRPASFITEAYRTIYSSEGWYVHFRITADKASPSRQRGRQSGGA